MRKINKYKIFNVVGIKTKMYPTRILKFRRPKWLRLQKLYLNSLKSKLVNILLIKNIFKSWERIKKYYKKSLETKNLLNSFYENCITSRSIKKNLNKTLIKKNLVSNMLLKPLFRVDILLWKLNLSASSYESKQAINSNLVLINGATVKSNFFLKKGDVISFNSELENKKYFFNCIKKYSLHENFLTFVEIDYYTKTVVILKNFCDLDYQDFSLITNEYLSTKKLSYR
jgi:ribosomal protein S4